ncbi:hypothetical protein ACI76W_06375 [Capnocytophaga canimorsus]|uniref:hypothetical protein n=1 Tax=Capnocytophaga canimorsus TaxID=28188 RepID=UPI0038595E54
MKQLKEFLKRQKRKIGIAIVPIVLLFSYQVNISWSDRWKYFVESIFKSAPLLFLYTFFAEWYDENKVFAISLSTAGTKLTFQGKGNVNTIRKALNLK